MRRLFYLVIVAAVFVFSGCSTKKVYKPEKDKLAGSWKSKGDLNSTIVDITGNCALLKNGAVLSNDKVMPLHVNTKTQRLIGADNEWVITGTIDGNITLISKGPADHNETFDLKKTVAAASVKDDLLAVVFANNELALYSVKTKDILFHSEGNAALTVDTRVVNPYFLDDLVLFLTLDGKMVIVNAKEKKVIKSMIISTADKFNNVIAFNVAGDNLIAATGYEVLALANKDIRQPSEVRDMRYDDKDGIYIATKQGEVINYTSTLQLKSKMKFPFAHFLGMVLTTDKVYLLEKEGYIIALDKELKTYQVFKASIDSDSYILAGEKAFYIDDEFYNLVK